MQEAMRTYLELAMGLTETSRKKVRKAVKEAVGRSGATADQVKSLTGDLMAANSANRDALAKLVRFEVDRALGVVGLATADEVGELTHRVRDLERQLREAEGGHASAPAAAKRTPAKRAPAKRSTAKVTAAASAASPAKKTAVATAPAKKTVAKKTAAKKAVAKKTAAKKAVAKKTVAKKTAVAARTASPARTSARVAPKTTSRTPKTTSRPAKTTGQAAKTTALAARGSHA
jgi:polyhydroxyalkanoate synthesis regulator phasin